MGPGSAGPDARGQPPKAYAAANTPAVAPNIRSRSRLVMLHGLAPRGPRDTVWAPSPPMPRSLHPRTVWALVPLLTGALPGCAYQLGADVALGVSHDATLHPQGALRAALGIGETGRWTAHALALRGAAGARAGRASLEASLGPEAFLHRRRGALSIGAGAALEGGPERALRWGGYGHVAWLWRVFRHDDPGRGLVTSWLGPELRAVLSDGPTGAEGQVSLGLRWVWESVRDFVPAPAPSDGAPPP